MLLITLTISSMTKRISNETLNLEHRWNPHVISFTAPTYKTDFEYGGFTRLDFGSITISPKMFVEEDYTEGGIFTDQSPYNWPPPVQGQIKAEYTTTNEAAAVTVFETNIHLTSHNNEEAVYDIRDKEYEKNLLPVETAYTEPHIHPRAFGTVALVPLKRVSTYIDPFNYYYSLGDIQLTSNLSKYVIGGLKPIAGRDTLIYTGNADGVSEPHPFSEGDKVYLGGMPGAPFNGWVWTVGDTSLWDISQVPITDMDISMYESLRGYWVPTAVIYGDVDVTVYDSDDVINANLYKVGGVVALYNNLSSLGAFKLTKNPVFLVSATGTASLTTVAEIMTWAAGELGLAYNGTLARSPSPPVYKWVDQQQLLIDFCSELCACNTHLFYISAGTLYLVDMYKDNGTRDLTEFQFFTKVEYIQRPPIKKLIYNQQRINIPTDSNPVRSTYPIEVSWCSYGTDINVTIFHDPEIAGVMYNQTAAGKAAESAIDMIKGVFEKQKATIKIPFGATLVYPGVRLAWLDTSLPIDTPCYIRARTVEYDFDNYEIVITGEGEMLRPNEMGVIKSG